MVSLSGAKIVVSDRDSMTDGNRIVTISGSPSAAQTAHIFCTEKIRKGQFARREGRDDRHHETEDD